MAQRSVIGVPCRFPRNLAEHPPVHASQCLDVPAPAWPLPSPEPRPPRRGWLLGPSGPTSCRRTLERPLSRPPEEEVDVAAIALFQAVQFALSLLERRSHIRLAL